jgi:hypothetical protein
MTMRDRAELLRGATHAVRHMAEAAGDNLCFGLLYDDETYSLAVREMTEATDESRCFELMCSNRALALLVVDLMRRVEELERLEADREAYFRERSGPGSDRPLL